MSAADLLVGERDFQALVVQLARLRGWRVYHTFDSRRSPAGFPDLVLARPPRLVIAELKSEKGRVADEQREWLRDFLACGVFETKLWRPSDWQEIEDVLR